MVREGGGLSATGYLLSQEELLRGMDGGPALDTQQEGLSWAGA